MKFIALKTKDGSSKGNITFFCRVLHVSRQGYYQYLVMKDRPWKYQPLADAMKDILTEDICNDTYGRTRMYQALTMKQPKNVDIPSERTVYRVMEEIGISRFSEDIDLILDWRVLGYGKDEPWEKRSNTKQDAFNKEANARAEVFLSETFCPAVKAGLSQEIGCEANVYIDEKDKQTVIFAYPHLFTNTATLQVIRLEIGALAAWTPAKTAQIEPYAAKYYPKIFEQKETAILTVAPERTFWEKATILHHEANRPEHLEMPQRYSRHYYDLYRMAATPVKEAAFSRLDLLKKVVDFKMKFYPRSWAKYPEAVPGTLKLLPPEYRFAALEADYNSMQDMLYGDVPTFETVIAAVQELEKEINTL